VGARRVSDGREIHRDASRFKLANALVQEDDENGFPARQAREGVDWREDLLRRPEYKQTRSGVQNQGIYDNRQTLNYRLRGERRMPQHLNDYVM
jgi:hypothetical protein